MKLRFISKKQESDDVWSYFFEPLESVEWLAGQSIRLELPRPTWGVDERRFTIASAPHEKHIQITTRLSGSSFKKSLQSLQSGAEINGFNIEGSFTWDESRPMLWLAAGIGITPLRSMLAQAIHEARNIDIILLYSSRDNPIVFADQLNTWSIEQPGLNIIYSQQRLDIESILTATPDLAERNAYISGPEQMVQQLSQDLETTGLPGSQIRRDLFTGYL